MANQQPRQEAPSGLIQPSSEIAYDQRIAPLGEENYATWKWQVTMLLKTRGLLECIENRCTDLAKNEQAAMILASSLSQLNMQRVINCTTANQIWKSLEATFENKSSTEKTMLMERFTSFKIGSIKDVSKSLGEIQAMAAKLKSLGTTIDDEFVICIILKALPDSMKNWRTTWKMVNAESPSINNLITGVMAQVNEMMAEPEVKALLAKQKVLNKKIARKMKQVDKKKRSQGKTKKDSSSESDSEEDKSTDSASESEDDACYYCGKQGHWARDCKKKKEADNKRARQVRGIAL